MSRKNRELSRRNNANNVYSNFLFGQDGRYNTDPNMAREALIERMYVRILTELAINRFKWTGLPASIDLRFLELTLFRNALSVFFKHETFGFLALNGSGSGRLNMYDNPTGFHVVGNNFVQTTLSYRQAVPIWANALRIPDLDIIMVYAPKFAEIDRTIEINTKNARRTKVIVASENMRLSAANINRQIDDGAAAVFINTGMDLSDMITAVDLGVNPDSLEKLHILKTRLWNECMGLLGIDNANQDKKERLVESEVDANNDQIVNTRNTNLNARKYAAKQINTHPLFKNDNGDQLNVSVDYNSAVELEANMPLAPGEGALG